MTVSLYLNLAWQTAILTLLGYVAYRAFKKIKFLCDSASMTAAIAYFLITLALLLPAAYVFGSAFIKAILSIFAAL